MQITPERLEDLPFLAGFMNQSGLPGLLDEHFPVHGSWQGPGYGKTAMGLLLYILSEGKHGLYGVESWASERAEALKWLLSCPDFEAKHLSDDRLGLLLERFKGQSYEGFQLAHNQGLLKAYELEGQSVARLDSTKAQSFCESNELFGKSHKQANKREDLVSLKAMMVNLDPLAMPISTLIARGNRADDQLYVPAIEKAWTEGLRRKGMLYVGDSKLGNLPNWAFIAQSGNYYLSPLALKQFSLAELDEALSWIEDTQALQVPFYGHRYEEGELPEGQSQPKAFCAELPSQTKSDSVTGLSWQHRLLAVCNVEMRQKQLASLEQRCEQAIIQIQERFIPKRGRKRITAVGQAQAIVDQALQQHKAQGLLEVHIIEPRKAKGHFEASCALNKEAYQQAQNRAGWCVYATNAPEQMLGPYDLLRIYRQQFRIEQQFHNLLNKCTALQPILLHKPNRIEALVRFLAIALQFVALIQHQTRENMAVRQQPYLTNLIPGNPGRKVYQPNTAMLLRVFSAIGLVVITADDGSVSYHVTGLNSLHQQIVSLAGLRPDTYLHPSCQRTDRILTEM